MNLAFALLFTVFKLIILLFEKQEQKNTLQIAQIENDMKFLRAQINPHFLFNSLNNIYSYAIQKKEETPELILKLSEILRFLSESKTEEKFGSSKKEISIVKQLSDMYLVNKRWQQKVNITIDNHLLETDYKIEPHSILTLVENAFKHTNLDDDASFIELNIGLNNGIVTLIRNKIRTDKKAAKSGIGLSNLIKRLNITYKTTHTYSVDNNQGIYTSKLILPIIP
jgi:two-component system, LytTR family, sensor kinase